MMKHLEEFGVYTLAISIVILASIIGISVYHITDRSLMAQNIDNAIAKGINPMSVRCSYVRGDDPICIAYAAKGEDPTLPATLTKK